MTKNTPKRILSGMRPTGKLHIGHYAGAIESWLQFAEEYENYYLIADYHVLTTNPGADSIYEDSIDMLIDWLACGLNPVKSPMFRQSQIKEHTELFLIFSMLISTGRLERNPTLKDQIRDMQLQEGISIGHLGYPVLQAADILLYKGNMVPVGEDQVPHIEITREIARRFNTMYGTVFPEPDFKLSKFARLQGLDGNAKMSKSLGNTIMLSDSEVDVKNKLKKAVTDTQKLRKGDPGRPEICLVFSYHQKFNTEETEQIAVDCRSGALGCSDCKLRCATKINDFLSPLREKRAYYEMNKSEVINILHDGEQRAKITASETMQQVREAMRLG